MEQQNGKNILPVLIASIPMDPDLLNQGRTEPIMHDRERPSWSYLQGFNDTNDVVA